MCKGELLEFTKTSNEIHSEGGEVLPFLHVSLTSCQFGCLWPLTGLQRTSHIQGSAERMAGFLENCVPILLGFMAKRGRLGLVGLPLV